MRFSRFLVVFWGYRIEVRAKPCTVPTDAHQNSKIPKNTIYHNTTNMGAIEDAIDDLNSQAKPNITATAKKYGCNRSTLSKRYRGVTGSKEAADNQQCLLNQH